MRIFNDIKGGLLPPFFVWSLFTICSGFSFAQDPVRVLFYNTENLFDTIDDQHKRDEDFTPTGKLKYDSERYNKKLDNLSQVINAAFENGYPSIIGLCEVENEKVVKSLVERIEGEFQVVHYESNDFRGIDNALVFATSEFKLIASGDDQVDMGTQESTTRGILWAVLKDLETQSEVIVCVNHWPSRYGGTEESNWKRLRASDQLIVTLNRLKPAYPEAEIVVMGDLNDGPSMPSVNQLTSCNDENDPCLVNQIAHVLDEGRGTHAYKREWDVLDHILVHQSMLDDKGQWKVQENAGNAVMFEWMTYESSYDFKRYPSRTYSGNKYYAGYSDHLPVTLLIERKPQ